MGGHRATGEWVVFTGCHALIGRTLAVGAMTLALSSAAPVQPALAQSLFEALFGGMHYHQRRAPMPHRASAYSDPFFGDDRPSYRRARSAEYHGPGPSSG